MNISKNFGARRLLCDINVTLTPASITILSGPNGSGKTTLLKIMAGLTNPTSGEIILAKETRLAYVGHATCLYPQLSALENLNFWRRAYNLSLSEDDLEKLLEDFGLGAAIDVPTRIFSRGMAQKLNLARAYMLKPNLCLLDEPTTGLDQSSQDLFQSKLLQLKEKGAAIILITHSPKECTFADAGFYLEQGRLMPMEGQCQAL
ncbi:MAG: heme ABC exporter ATP-binding protein CcmA [Desulfovibrionaceae bacterium]|nr:heme ABC exporter ATP-binding protein CcmA [Desulfovibrionaceae bacterium]